MGPKMKGDKVGKWEVMSGTIWGVREVQRWEMMWSTGGK